MLEMTFVDAQFLHNADALIESGEGMLLEISTRKRPYGHRRADSHVVGKQELTGEPQGD